MVSALPRLERPLVLYQGTCPFCRAAARLVARSESVAILPFQDPEATPFMESIPEHEREESWHLFDGDGRRYSKGQAGLRLMQEIRGLKIIASILTTLRLGWLVGAIYWLISISRSKASYLVRDRPGPRRFP